MPHLFGCGTFLFIERHRIGALPFGELTLALPNLKVAWSAIVECEPYGCADAVETVAPCRSGVDVEHTKTLVVAHTQDVAVATDKDGRAERTDACIDLSGVATTVETYVRHQHLNPLALKTLPLGVGEPHRVVVNIAIDCHDGLAERGDGGRRLGISDVACTPNLVDLGQKVAQRLIESSVGIRYNSYFQHLLLLPLGDTARVPP